MENRYNPKDFEEKLYQHWEEAGYFKQILKHLELKRFVELITNYFNENRRELVVC